MANIQRRRTAKTGSCVITLNGPHAGDWIDFDGGEGGGPISAIEQATGLSGQALIAQAAELAGVGPGAPTRQAPPPQPLPRRDSRPEIERILSGAVPIQGTPAERYLAGRGLTVPEVAADLLFHPDLTHWESRSGYPGMVALVRNRDGDIVGLHRTYLAELPDGRVVKAAVGIRG